MGGGPACCVCLPARGCATVPTPGHGPGAFSFMIIVFESILSRTIGMVPSTLWSQTSSPLQSMYHSGTAVCKMDMLHL